MQVGLTVEELRHLPHDGPVPPGTVPDEVHAWATRRSAHRLGELSWISQLYDGPYSKDVFENNRPV